MIFLNGTSSSGKSTIAEKLQECLDKAYLHVSVDGFIRQLPVAYLVDEHYLEKALPNLLAGFDASTAAIARAGNNVIVDHVLQEPSWVSPCAEAFTGLAVVFVGVHCSLDVLESREKARGDRDMGLARYQYDRVHSHGTYDVEVDTSKMSVRDCALLILDYVRSGKRPTAFEKLRAPTGTNGKEASASSDRPSR